MVDRLSTRFGCPLARSLQASLGSSADSSPSESCARGSATPDAVHELRVVGHAPPPIQGVRSPILKRASSKGYLLLNFQELWGLRCSIEATLESRVYFGSSG